MKFSCKLITIGTLLCLFAHQLFAQSTPFGFSSFERDRSMERARMFNLRAYKSAQEEGRNLVKWWRGENTIGIAITSPATYSERSKYDSVAYMSTPNRDSTIKGKAQSLIGLHINGNTNHMLVRLSMNSILSFSEGVQIDVLRWKYQTFNGNALDQVSSSLTYFQAGIPVTIDYKWGCDVDFDPEIKSCFAVGAGAMPLLGMGFNELDAQNNFHIAPYFYASFGIYAWGCWKIRATYMPGKFDVFKDLKANYAGNINTLNVQGNQVFTIGIAMAPYSRDWNKGGRAWRGAGNGHHYHRHTNGTGRMF